MADLTSAWKSQATLDAERLEEFKDSVRHKRDTLLTESDWTQMADSPLSLTQKESWKTYRQDLRDVPQQTGFPEDVVWPTKP